MDLVPDMEKGKTWNKAATHDLGDDDIPINRIPAISSTERDHNCWLQKKKWAAGKHIEQKGLIIICVRSQWNKRRRKQNDEQMKANPLFKYLSICISYTQKHQKNINYQAKGWGGGKNHKLSIQREPLLPQPPVYILIWQDTWLPLPSFSTVRLLM